jgi:hypothetical protein
MKEILDWLLLQNGGVRTFLEFYNRALAMGATNHEQAASARLLADLAYRFAARYDGDPLPASVAERALARLIALVEKVAACRAAEPIAQLRLLNEIGNAELT